MAKKEKELKELREEVKRLRKSLEEMDTIRSIVFHDLKNLISPIVSTSELLQELAETQTKVRGEYLDLINRQALNSLSFLREMIIWIKLKRKGGNTLKMIGLEEIVEAIFAEISILKRKITFENWTTNITFLGDAESIKAIIRNLVVNAIKFSPDGGKVVVAAVKGADFVKISVTDSGVGIAEEKKQLILSREIASENTGYNTGIGLYLCQELLEYIGGSLAIENGKKGTVFSFTVPI